VIFVLEILDVHVQRSYFRVKRIVSDFQTAQKFLVLVGPCFLVFFHYLIFKIRNYTYVNFFPCLIYVSRTCFACALSLLSTKVTETNIVVLARSFQ
jgi:hypothetical protein